MEERGRWRGTRRWKRGQAGSLLWERGRSGAERRGDEATEWGNGRKDLWRNKGLWEEQISHDIICEMKPSLRLRPGLFGQEETRDERLSGEGKRGLQILRGHGYITCVLGASQRSKKLDCEGVNVHWMCVRDEALPINRWKSLIGCSLLRNVFCCNSCDTTVSILTL